MQKAGAGFSPGCVWSRRNQEAGGGLNSLKSQKISVLLCMAQEKDKLRLFWVFRKMGQHSKCLPRNFQSQWGWAELLVTSLGNNYHEAKIRKEILLNAFFLFFNRFTRQVCVIEGGAAARPAPRDDDRFKWNN